MSPNPQNVLGAYFHDATLADVSEKTKTMVTYYDTEASVPFFLKSWEPEHATVEMVRAARVTSAVSTDFEPFRFSIGTETRILFDGGIFINSPVISVYEEAKRIISQENPSITLKTLISLFYLWELNFLAKSAARKRKIGRN